LNILTKFVDFGLDEKVLKAIMELGFEEATPIQSKAIPIAMEDRSGTNRYG
jgi:ATP-dependent RNA helicase DeaD